MFAKVRVLLSAVPTYGAAAQTVITAVSAAVVPVLPVHVGVKVAAYLAAAAASVTAVVKVVSRVTPVVDEAEKGLIAARDAFDFDAP